MSARKQAHQVSPLRALLMRWLYSALFLAALPAVLLGFVRRGFSNRAYWHRWSERFGFCPLPAEPHGLWVHAASVGEFNAAIPLIRALLRANPGLAMTLTCVTPTGSARIQDVFRKDIAAGAVMHSYLPFDTPIAVRRFMRRVQPVVGVIIETELWPNLYAAAHRCSTRIVLSNARISERSARRFAKVPSLSSVMLGRVSYALAQSEADADRLRRIGARPRRVRIAGNIKYDLRLGADFEAKAAALKHAVGLANNDAPVLVAGSVHPGEWPIVLNAFSALRKRIPTCRLILVPRHPERFFDCAHDANQFAKGQWTIQRRSDYQTQSNDQDWDVLIGDSLGELLAYYALGQVAFVGGSLIDGIGGHNPLEPAALGLPVLFGPYRSVFPEAGMALADAAAGWVVHSASELAAQTRTLWSDPALARSAGDNGRRLLENNRGAAQQAVDAVAECVLRHDNGMPLAD